MFTLKRYTVPCPENEKDFFKGLFEDTEQSASEWHDILRSGPYDKTWLGNVDQDKEEFEVQYTQSGIFKTRVSRFRIKGKVKKGVVSKMIEVEMGFATPLVSELLISLIVAIVITVGSWPNAWVLLLGPFVAILFLLYLFDDFFGSEDLFRNYLKDPEKASKLVVKK
jgi:hypothetical protein